MKANLPGLLSRFAQVPQQHRFLEEFRRWDRRANDMTVGDEEIQSAIEIVVDEVGAEADVVEADGGHAGPAAGIDELGGREFPGPP